MNKLNFPPDLLYHPEHLWVRRLEDGLALIGVSDFAQDQLGKVVYIDLPQPDDAVEAGREMGAIESAKSVSDLIAPLSGVVVEVNAALDQDPSPLNADPYGQGWIAKIRPSQPEELDALLPVHEYLRRIQ
ncbi:glycine cleavage system H protein [Desulfarculus baarsii DSM 2075]|uniref:Glycine cleavage system H protein n=1 Tax=Desulfarculus baarsii (strain ATCC 33931 / DSM 2075 / LMG 7858 / VKM B-1802 / 2st14) TaxID=644282 RepID=E1QDZ9_DESB2|nr:glycine cleavage system protein GcvH [Desulfarculus baarsii]ADK83785.1 glycine cleavage system H protein [Desulfarculus baarsii DSM 2075]